MQFTHSAGADPLLSKEGLIKTVHWSVVMWCQWNDDQRVDEMISAESLQYCSPSLGSFQRGVSILAANSACTGGIALEVKEREERGGKRRKKRSWSSELLKA